MCNATISIDKDIVDSLRGLYFGDLSDLFYAAAHRAYCDFNRTLRLKKILDDDQSDALCNQGIAVLKNAFQSVNSTSIKHQDAFDKWHRDTAKKLIALYKAVHVNMFYGQAQKWINMTAKYMYLIGLDKFEGVFQYLHIPIDNYVLDLGLSIFDIGKPNKAWSQLNEVEYFRYQELLRSSIESDSPLRWEFHNWLALARSLSNNP